MAEGTRVVRLTALAERNLARNEGTRVSGPLNRPRSFVSPQHLFNRHQRLVEHTELGVLVFAFSARTGFAGDLWLRGTTGLRSGTIGRHSSVDLYLDSDDGFSLRQSVVLVRSVLGVPLIRVVDLDSSTGFSIGDQAALHAVDADGAFCLRAGDYVFFVSPTGAAPPWNPGLEDPWSTLPQAVVATRPRREAPAVEAPPRDRGSGSGQTNVSRLRGPTTAGAAPLLEAGEAAAGVLHLTGDEGSEHLEVGAAALDRGVLVGRYSRCGGGAWASANVSRVHALVIRVDGAVWIVDTGSTNSTWIDGTEARCAQLGPGVLAQLSQDQSLTVRWHPA